MAQPLIELDALGGEVGPPDQDAAAAVAERLSEQRALGRLREVAEWLAGAQGPRLRPFGRVVLVSPTTVGAELTALAEPAGALVRRAEPAATGVDLAAGVAMADDEVDRGADLAVLAGTSTGLAPLVAVSVLTGAEPVQVLARGAAACAPEQWMSRAAEVRDTRRRVNALRDRPEQLLAALACPPLAAATGFALRASARRTPLVLDGVLALAAALIAQQVAPNLAGWVQVADTARQPAAGIAAAALGKQALLDLGVGRDDGTAGLLAVPVLRAAVALAGEGQPE